MGRYLAAEGLLPNHVIVSTAERTQQTWRLLVEELDHDLQAVSDQRLYEAAPADILAVIADAPAGAGTLLVIGHNPGLQETALMLTGSGARSERAKMRAKFPTAALVVLAFDQDNWRLEEGRARLERFVTPRGLQVAAE